VVAQVKKIKASHVILGTVPHVTIAPIAHGVATGSARTGKVRPGSRYFPFYTYPWISDQDFDPNADPHITANEARAVDSAVDQYNDFIEAAVRDARNAGLDWYLIDMAGLLDRLASRRYIEDPAAQPAWWKPYPLPPALAELQPPPDSRFLVSGPTGRVQGGLFALDGVHPTTVAYGILAQEVINIMRLSGVRFFSNDRPTERIGPIEVDFDRLISLDTLISNPPRSLGSDLKLIGWLEHRFDLVRRIVS